jgi:hypothetical protein
LAFTIAFFDRLFTCCPTFWVTTKSLPTARASRACVGAGDGDFARETDDDVLDVGRVFDADGAAVAEDSFEDLREGVRDGVRSDARRARAGRLDGGVRDEDLSCAPGCEDDAALAAALFECRCFDDFFIANATAAPLLEFNQAFHGGPGGPSSSLNLCARINSGTLSLASVVRISPHVPSCPRRRRMTLRRVGACLLMCADVVGCGKPSYICLAVAVGRLRVGNRRTTRV